MAPITATYAGLLGLLFVLLSARAIRSRRRERIPLGAGDSPIVLRATRVHANFAEYVPLALVLMLLAELGATNGWLIHGVGLALLAGRVVHAYGVSQTDEDYRFRVTGMVLSLSAIVAAALLCLASVAVPRG